MELLTLFSLSHPRVVDASPALAVLDQLLLDVGINVPVDLPLHLQGTCRTYSRSRQLDESLWD